MTFLDEEGSLENYVSSHAKRVKTYLRDKKDVPLTRKKVKISDNKPCCIKKQAI